MQFCLTYSAAPNLCHASYIWCNVCLLSFPTTIHQPKVAFVCLSWHYLRINSIKQDYLSAIMATWMAVRYAYILKLTEFIILFIVSLSFISTIKVHFNRSPTVVFCSGETLTWFILLLILPSYYCWLLSLLP